MHFTDQSLMFTEVTPYMEMLPIDGKKKTCHNILNQKVNLKGDALVEITYTNNKVKKYFEDYNKMQKKIPF